MLWKNQMIHINLTVHHKKTQHNLNKNQDSMNHNSEKNQSPEKDLKWQKW